MKYRIMVFALFVVTLPSCTLEEILAELGHSQQVKSSSVSQNDSYCPMHVGNRWELGYQEDYQVVELYYAQPTTTS